MTRTQSGADAIKFNKLCNKINIEAFQFKTNYTVNYLPKTPQYSIGLNRDGDGTISAVINYHRLPWTVERKISIGWDYAYRNDCTKTRPNNACYGRPYLGVLTDIVND